MPRLIKGKNQMPRIALVAAYFGKLPIWIDYFTETCRYNQSVDWIIFTDDAPPNNKPDNVRFLPMSMEDTKSLLSKKLRFNAGFNTPYKMCDFKPAYGFVFGEQLKGYDFWGHIDLDVLYGDISKFISEKVLEQYDIISADKNRICGVVTIYKNTPEINSLFMHDPRYEEVYKDEQFGYFCENKFDETVKRFLEDTKIKCLFGDFQRYGRSRVPSYWINGRLITRASGEESIFLHLRPIRKYLVPKEFSPQYSRFGWKITKKTIKPLSERKSQRIQKKYPEEKH
jgi:hypothetical protein